MDTTQVRKGMIVLSLGLLASNLSSLIDRLLGSDGLAGFFSGVSTGLAVVAFGAAIFILGRSTRV